MRKQKKIEQTLNITGVKVNQRQATPVNRSQPGEEVKVTGRRTAHWTMTVTVAKMHRMKYKRLLERQVARCYVSSA